MAGHVGGVQGLALGGNMLDLALGFILGTAFAGFSALVLTVNGADVRYGAFL